MNVRHVLRRHLQRRVVRTDPVAHARWRAITDGWDVPRTAPVPAHHLASVPGAQAHQ